jgi:geranylgeranyl diphosphate synthase, type II
MSTREPHGLEQDLTRYSALLDEALQRWLPTGVPAKWLYDLASAYPNRGGKRYRPTLCLAACEAFGGRLGEALPSALAIELLHSAFLVHDDIADDSDIRRGEPTLHAQHGVPLALNAGDFLAIAALQVVRDSADVIGQRLSGQVLDEFLAMARHTLEGQAIEAGWRHDVVVDLTADDYLDLVLKKTCWYTVIHPLRVGLLIGSLGAADPARVVDFGFHLGVAFQIRDDVLNLCGDEGEVGKEILGDLLEGKRTLMLIHLLNNVRGDERAQLHDYLRRSRAERTLDEARQLKERMEHFGCFDIAQSYATLYAARAYDTFADAFGSAANTDAGRLLRRMIDYTIERRS